MLTLALGIGANTAIFTVVQSVLLAPLPYQNADRLALLKTYRSQIGRAIAGVTGPDGADIRDQSKSLKAVSLYSGGNLGVQLKDHAAYTVVTMADANFARIFSLRPVAGRLYTEADAKHAVMVSERFARDNFGASQAAIGQVLGIEGEPMEIVGVLPAGFDYPNRTQVWVATTVEPQWYSRSAFNYKAVALLRENTTFKGAQTELKGISQRLQATYAKDNRGKEMRAPAAERGADGRFATDADVSLGCCGSDSADCVRECDASTAGALDGAAERAGDTPGAGLVTLARDAAGVFGERSSGADRWSRRSIAGISDGACAGGDGSKGAATIE